MGAAGRARALEEFSQERCTDRIEELYRAALARAAERRSRSSSPRPLERERREQREHEVPRHAVAHRSGEDHRHQRC